MKVVAQNYVGYYLDDIFIPLSKIKWRDLGGKPYIWHVVERLKRCKKIDEIVLLAQDTISNRKVIALAEEWRLNLRYFIRGPLNWDSWLKWHTSFNADIVVYESTPLTDPTILDSMIDYFITKDLDYLESADNPLMLMYKTKICPRLYELGRGEDVGTWPGIAKERSDLFKSDTFDKLQDLIILGPNTIKWYSLLKSIYDKFYKPPEIINIGEVFAFYEEEPQWFEIFSQDQLEIEITNDCNLRCIICPRTSKMGREIGYMDLDLFEKIIDEAGETGAMSLHFSGLGESHLHPQARDMFAYAKEKGLEVGLWTNGLNLDEELSREIIEKGLLDYIIFGLDAATKETYSKVKGVDLFDKAVENINRFLKLKKERVTGMEKDTHGWWGQVKPIIGVQILKMKENDAEIEQFMDKWDYMDKTKKMINYKNRSQELNKIEDEQERSQASQKLNKELWETFYTKIELPVEYAIIGHFNNYCGQIEDRSVIDVTPLKRFSCKQLSSPTILWNGDALLCRHDLNGEHLLGNLKEQDMKSINNKIEEVWQAHRDGRYNKFPLCANCKKWYYNLYA